MRKWFIRILLGLGVLALLVMGSCVIFSKSLPKGKTGPEADKLARAVEKAVNIKAWNNVGAIQWDFGGRHFLVWDKKRSLTKVTWGKGRLSAMISLANPKLGLAYQDGKPVNDAAIREKMLGRAYALWANDSFWLNPLAKLFDKGVTRSIVKWEGKPQLMVSYSSGGVTPGDSYLFLLDDNKRPTGWRMWVKILPLKGGYSSFSKWITLPGGAQISTQHKTLGLLKLKLTKIKSADSTKTLLGEDVFAPLLKLLPGYKAPQPRRSSATSRPAPQPAKRPTVRPPSR